jgi:hypothetical protein
MCNRARRGNKKSEYRPEMGKDGVLNRVIGNRKTLAAGTERGSAQPLQLNSFLPGNREKKVECSPLA